MATVSIFTLSLFASTEVSEEASDTVGVVLSGVVAEGVPGVVAGVVLPPEPGVPGSGVTKDGGAGLGATFLSAG